MWEVNVGYFYQAVSFGDNMIGILDALSSNLTSYLDFSPDTEILSDNIGNHLLTFIRRLFSIHAGALEQNIYVIRTKFIQEFVNVTFTWKHWERKLPV